MKLIIDIPEERYNDIRTKNEHGQIFNAVKNGTPISEWLSSFNTESAPKCFEAVQKLKMEVNADDE